MRIVLAGILGAVAMFVWTSLAHMATPLGNMGLSQIPNEAPLTAEMQRVIGDKDGLYIYPWVDPKDANAMKDYAAKLAHSASGLLLYHAPGASGDMTMALVYEFVKEFVEALIAAFLLGWAGIASYLGRAGFVTLVGVSASISTNASYWIWYKFPCSYTLAYIAITLIGYLVAGLVMAAIVKPAAAR